MTYKFKDTRCITMIETLIEKVLSDGVRKCVDTRMINEDEYIKLTKQLYYSYKRLLICNYESLNDFRKQHHYGSEQSKNFLSFLQMEILKCDEEFKTLLHYIDELINKSVYFDTFTDEDEEDLYHTNDDVFPIRIILSKNGVDINTYNNYMNSRKFVRINDINKQCKVIGIAISRSLSKFKDNIPNN